MILQLLSNSSGMTVPQIILSALIMFFALCLSFSIHEFMHAKVSDWLGDDVARLQGRVTLNPIAHLDPMGTLLILFAGFGWGKPVMYNPNNLSRFKSKRLMNIMVHLAGVTGNFILSLLSMILCTIIVRICGYSVTVPITDVLVFASAGISGSGNVPALAAIICYLFYYVYFFSLGLLAFNLLPIPPLDGFHVLQELLPVKVRYSEGYQKFERMSPMIILVVLLLGRFTNLNILSTLITFIELPFHLLINLICMLIGFIG
ncbi:MAG: site-2 protease family protein [Saccharofermentans sp.]|nr:site-2 protease family protein [Saccharofermentans sp.]